LRIAYCGSRGERSALGEKIWIFFQPAIGGFREGFRMPAEHERSSEHKGYKAGVRKPPMKEPAGSR
jgi:hypothetical protein